MLTKKKITRRPREQRMEEICSVAKAAFAAHGYEGAVMSDIAAAAQVAEGTVYKLFASKRELLFKVMQDWYREFIDDVEQSLRGIEDPAQKLRFLIWHHLQTIKDDPALCRVFFREVRAYDHYRGSAMFKLNQEYTAFTIEVLRDGVEAGNFRRDISISLIRDTIFGGLEHYVWQYLAGTKSLDVEKTTTQFWQLIVAGITADKPALSRSDQRLAPLIERLEAVAHRLEHD